MGFKDRRTTKAARLSLARPIVVNGLRLFWGLVVLWGELGVYLWSAESCSWPDSHLPGTPTHVMLLSDPQVKPPNPSLEDTWRDYLADIVFQTSMKRSWRVAKGLKPDVVVFLGDMLSAGKYVRSEKEYTQYFEKFQDAFPISANTSMYFIPGNNDVGMGVSRALSNKVRANYLSVFGPSNHATVIHDHHFVFLDAPGLIDEDYQRSAQGVSYDGWEPLPEGPVEFVHAISIDPIDKPLILLTHIPLARPDNAPCGPLRERGSIRKGVGHGYQNTLGKYTTSFLLKKLHPTVVFSGDNRDYCDYTHHANTEDPTDDIREVTVKSFSMARNIRHPGFHLLSLTDPMPEQKSYADTPCALPNQETTFEDLYAPFMIFTVAALFIINYTRRTRLKTPSSISIATTRTPTTLSPGWTYGQQRTSPLSPPSSLPSALRTPNAATELGSSFRATSHHYPDTPHGTPPLGSPMFNTNEEEDAMFPSQYANRTETWSPDHGAGQGLFHGNEPEIITSLSTNMFSDRSHQRRAWSWTFMLLGRRRRITLRAPELSWSGLMELAMLLGGGTSDGLASRRGLLSSTVIDTTSIALPIFFLWTFTLWVSS